MALHSKLPISAAKSKPLPINAEKKELLKKKAQVGAKHNASKDPTDREALGKLFFKLEKEIQRLEDEETEKENNAKKQLIQDKIFSECSDFLKSIKKSQTLYRGVNRKAPIAFKSTSRDKRRPRDSYPSDQKNIDELLQLANIKALRSNSIFCSGDFSQASKYGLEYAIFPINGFSFSWSEKYNDLTTDLFSHSGSGATLKDKPLPILASISKEAHQFVYFDNIAEVSNDVKDLNLDKNQLKLLFRVYLLARKIARTWGSIRTTVDNPAVKKLIQDVMSDKKVLKGVAKLSNKNKASFLKDMLTYYKSKPNTNVARTELEFTDTNMSAALSSDHEILIHGSYYALQYKFWEDLITNLSNKKRVNYGN